MKRVYALVWGCLGGGNLTEGGAQARPAIQVQIGDHSTQINEKNERAEPLEKAGEIHPQTRHPQSEDTGSPPQKSEVQAHPLIIPTPHLDSPRVQIHQKYLRFS